MILILNDVVDNVVNSPDLIRLQCCIYRIPVEEPRALLCSLIQLVLVKDWIFLLEQMREVIREQVVDGPGVE